MTTDYVSVTYGGVKLEGLYGWHWGGNGRKTDVLVELVNETVPQHQLPMSVKQDLVITIDGVSRTLPALLVDVQHNFSKSRGSAETSYRFTLPGMFLPSEV